MSIKFVSNQLIVYNQLKCSFAYVILLSTFFALKKKKKRNQNKNIFGRGPEKESDDDGVIYSKGEGR